jgi:hypothetical protein
MKILVFVLLSTFCFKATAQSRWMFLCKSSNNSTISLVDTLKDDVQQVSSFDGHENVSILWINTFVKDTTANIVTNTKMRIAIDTTYRQMRILSMYKYKDGNIVFSSTSYNAWTDVIPESLGESYLRYAKELKCPLCQIDFLLNALKNIADNHPFGVTP